ncbi:hypothetical protein NQZ68_031182 [Dissostichus eleginoides]|nr:hypothetical protein NQZ68_031182 [Dissostichus eleginoides]
MSILLQYAFQGALPFTKKRELSPGLPPASPGSFALPHWTPRGAYLRHSRFGDLNPTPFRSAGGDVGHRPTLQNGVRPSLKTDLPMFNCCSHGTLLHFGLQSSRLNICYYHQDLHSRRLHPGPRPRLPCSPRRASYSLRRSPRSSCCQQRPGMGPMLQRHPFSGLVDSAGPLRASTRVSSGFALPRHSSPSFGSYRMRSRSTSPTVRARRAGGAPSPEGPGSHLSRRAPALTFSAPRADPRSDGTTRLERTEDSPPQLTVAPGTGGPVPPPGGREGTASTLSTAPGSGEVRAEGAVKHAAEVASHLRPEPFQAVPEPVAVHRRGGNAPGGGQPASGRGPTRRSSHTERPTLTRRVESPGRTARTPPKTGHRRDGGRYRPHTVHGLSLDQKDSGPRATPDKRSSIRHISPIRPSDGDSALGSSLFARRY